MIILTFLAHFTFYVQVFIITVSAIDIEVDNVNEILNIALGICFLYFVWLHITIPPGRGNVNVVSFLRIIFMLFFIFDYSPMSGFEFDFPLIVYLNCLLPVCDIKKEYY